MLGAPSPDQAVRDGHRIFGLARLPAAAVGNSLGAVSADRDSAPACVRCHVAESQRKTHMEESMRTDSLLGAIVGLAAHIRGKPDWAGILRARREAGMPATVASRDLRPAFNALWADLRRGRTANALAISRAAAFLDSALFIREARRHGIFRSSKVAFHSEPVEHIVKTLLEDGPVLNWASDDALYLQSVQNLLSLAPCARATRQAVIAELTKRRPVVVKSCMVCVDRAFRPSIDHFPSEEEQLAEATGQPDYFQREQKAAGFSTIVMLMQEVVGWPKTATVLIDEEGIRDGTFEHLLMEAARLGEFMEAEVQLDAYPYRADLIGGQGKTVIISAMDARLEQAIELGYVHANMQSQLAHRYDDAEVLQVASLRDAALELHRVGGHHLVERREAPQDRYVMNMPLAPQIVRLLTNNRAFREEALYLHRVGREAFARDSYVGDMPLLPGMTVMDMVKVQRFFTFTATVFFQALDQPALGGDRDKLDMRSRIPVFRDDVLLDRLSTVFGEQIAKRALEMLSFDPKKGGHCDIQYTPLLHVDGHYMLPMSVLVSSDIIRNTLYHHSARLLPADGHDPMVRGLREALETCGFLAAEGIKGKFNGKAIEIDLLAYAQGHLFIMEGKNAFHPCSVQEMRTSFDHIKKAGRQLTRAAEWLASREVQTRVFGSLGWKVPPATDIRTCVVTANRIFSGYAIEGHPVRQAHEVLNVVTKGIVTFNNGEQYRFWRGESFSVVDLLDYLEGNTLVRDSFEAMNESTVRMSLRGGGQLMFRTFGVDFEGLRQRMQERYTRLHDAAHEAVLPDAVLP